MTYRLPPPSTIPSLPADALHELISHLFEPSPALVSLIPTLLSPSAPPTSYPAFISTVRTHLHSLPPRDPTLLSILSSHPRLGAKKVDSAHSQAEQRSLQGSEDETERLRRLNEEYEGRFPGLRYVVFVNGRSREVVMEDMKRRIEEGSFEKEVQRAVDAMCDIALDRVGKLEREAAAGKL